MSDLSQARQERDEGMSLAVERADRAISAWSELAIAWIRLYAQQHRGQQYTGRQIVLASRESGVIQPPNDKAWGSPMQRAARAGVIRRVGTVPDPNRHCNPVPLWESA
jgi:hypothetical protein